MTVASPTRGRTDLFRALGFETATNLQQLPRMPQISKLPSHSPFHREKSWLSEMHTVAVNDLSRLPPSSFRLFYLLLSTTLPFHQNGSHHPHKQSPSILISIMALLRSHRWRLRQSHLLQTIYLMGLFSVIGIVLIWYGVNSDREYIHPLLTQLIPAGHCACLTSTTFQCASCLKCAPKKPLPPTALPAVSAWKFEAGRDSGNEGLSRAQCMAAFPGLFEDILRAGTFWRTHGGLDVEHLEYIPLKHGMARAFIHRGELYVVNALSRGEHHRRKILAVLSAIHRALITNPERAIQQDLEFVFSVEDKVTDVTTDDQPIWAFARSAGEEAVWLMPDFGYWAWENVQNSIGPYDQVVDHIKCTEIPWSQKKRQLVWRGKPSFAPKLRRALMDAARGQPWGDVKHVDWNQRTNVMSLEDHCRYMFIAHVEGKLLRLHADGCIWSSATLKMDLRTILFRVSEIPPGVQLGCCSPQAAVHPASPLPAPFRRTEPELHRSRQKFQ